MPHRLFQIVLVISFVAFSWLGFMLVHELGHMVAARFSGATLSRVVLHPLQISWSAFSPNPHPLIVAWGGPVFGAVLPFLAYLLARSLRLPGLYLYRFFSGFCLVANGLYLLIDAFDRAGDGGALLTHGAQLWHLLAFSVITVPPGFYLWHGLGPHFGLGAARGTVSCQAALASVILLAFVVAGEVILSR